jgi:hypothetical protein
VTDRLRNVSRRTAATVVAGVFLFAFASIALAGSGFKNGGFETGDFTGWDVASSGDGTWFVLHAGPLPLSGNSWAGPTEHDFAAVTDSDFPASGVISRVIKVGSKQVRLSLMLYYTNYATGFCTPKNLHETYPGCNQQLRIDIIKPNADPYTTAGSDIIKGVFKTKNGTSKNVLEPTLVSANLTGLGDKVRLRIAWVANEDFFNVTVDDVRVANG